MIIERAYKMTKKPAIKQPPKLPIKSPQYDLFSQFVTNDKDKVSNTAEVWESIPKYFFTPRQVEKLRTPTGHADPFEWSYNYNTMIIKLKYSQP
jgi:hypothetical protein